MTISGNFERSQYFNLKTYVLRNANLFEKLKYLFLVENIKIENATFPYKTALSEANVKTNGMTSTKWTYHKEWISASNYFIYLISV